MVGSGNIFQSMNSTVTMNLSVIFNLRGINLTLSAACASGSHAIGMGYLMIRQGLQERVVCGGAQEVNLYSVGSFDGLGAFSARESDPAAASRPFDKDRDGLVPSGGAATVILESHESAVARAPKSWAKWSGTGSRRTASISPCRTLTARAVRCCGVWRTPECGPKRSPTSMRTPPRRRWATTTRRRR